MNVVFSKKTVKGDCAWIRFFLIAYQFLIKYNPCESGPFFPLGYFLQQSLDSAKLIIYLIYQIKKFILPG